FGFGSEEQLHGIPMKRGEPVRFVARMRTRAGFSALRIGIRAPEDPHEFERAVSLAAECDTAIVVVGTNDEWETEGHDRDSIALPGRQDELVARVTAVARRTIVVVNAGAPVAMPWLNDVDAVLIGFFGGMEMGRAIADVVSGVRDPGGRLPVVYPRLLSDSPAMRDYGVWPRSELWRERVGRSTNRRRCVVAAVFGDGARKLCFAAPSHGGGAVLCAQSRRHEPTAFSGVG
ncbi:MAG: hypothetical protein EBW98_01995, partial [Actinobacteria bacterium]|nr:hypothetical protein [Actinomycetota bacterium]